MGAEASRDHYNDCGVCRNKWISRPARRVEVAYTQFGPGLPGIKAYHTSVILQDVEYAFGAVGVEKGVPLSSHQFLARQHDVMVVGHTTITGDEMMMVLHPIFQKGTYDLLHKNCNSFTDSALFLLLGIRLNPEFCDLEKLGYAAERAFLFMQVISGGTYRPNLASKSFDIEKVIARITDVKRNIGMLSPH